MISKKTKALTAGILTAAMSASAIVPTLGASAANQYATENDANTTYAKMFESLYADVITNGQENGYLSKNTNGSDSFGIPYHARETFVVEAPDYGHETTSEAMSYIAWICAMHDVLQDQGLITKGSADLGKAWNTLEALVPGYSVNSYEGEDKVVSGEKYKSFWDIAMNGMTEQGIKADALSEQPDPKEYPEKQEAGGNAYNPIAMDFAKVYSSDNGYYLLHWLADVDDWYGFGGATPGAGNGKFTFINTFQRGEHESCFETVPQPCLEELKYGMTSSNTDNGNGIKAIFNGENKVPKQYAFTNAPDAEDRAIQAVFFANQWKTATGEVSSKAGKMGDECRNDMFDKFYKKIGIGKTGKGMRSESCMNKTDSQHYLMAWYTSWGGQLTATWGSFKWAWQIGCSHSHQFYQNPLAAYALVYDSALNDGMKAASATEDYKKSLQRQIEMYLWLQSADGPFAGGCTNSKNGNYSAYDASEPTFYDMAYVEHPVYADPGSNHWIGNQVWSLQRLAELYYYVKTDNSKLAVTGDKSAGEITYGGLSLEEALETLVGRQVKWFLDNLQFDYVAEDGTKMAYAMPSSLDWSGKPASWDANTKYDPDANSGLTCKITGYGQGDIGCISSLCNTFIYYAAANGVSADVGNGKAAATTDAEKALITANKLMTLQWNTARDEYGIAYEDHNGSLKRVYEQEVWIPSYYKGTMPDGSPLDGSTTNTFSSIRKIYEDDPMYKECKAVYEATGETEDYKYKLHRFWHMGDALMTTGTMALLYPDVLPYDADIPDPKTDADWGNANCDEKVDVADAVKILQYIANSEKYPLTEQGAINADCVDAGKGITGMDALAVQMIDAKLISQSDFSAPDGITEAFLKSKQG